MNQLSNSSHAKVELPLQRHPVDVSRGVFAFATVEVPAVDGYTIEATLVDGMVRCWPLLLNGAWHIFETPEDAEEWLADWREEDELDWSDWASAADSHN